MDATGVDELLRLQRRAVKLRGMPPADSVLSPEDRAGLDQFVQAGVEEPPWLWKYLPNPPTPLQYWDDWLLLAEGLTALDGVLQRVAMPRADVLEHWRKAPRLLNFGQWLHMVLAEGDLTVGSVPTNALHAATRKVSDGYLVVVKQGLLRFVRELVTIYEFAGTEPATDDEVTRRLTGLMDAYAAGSLSGPATRNPPWLDAYLAGGRVLALIGGRHDPSTGPRGLTRDVLAPLFVVLHEFAHVYHGDADLSEADAARLEAEYDDQVERSGQPLDESVLFAAGSPAGRSERWADSDALEAIIEMQRFVKGDDSPLAAMSPDVNTNLQVTALESAYLAMVALHLVHSTTGQKPSRGHPDPYDRLTRLGMAAVYDATVDQEAVETVDGLIGERLGPAARQVLDRR